MKLAVVVAFVLTAALSLSPMLAGARRPLADPPAAALPRSSAGDEAAPPPPSTRANLTEILSLDGPFHTFLGYLQRCNLVELFDDQAYRTDQGITILVPVDRAFAAVKPSVLSGLSKGQLKNLMMCHSLARHYSPEELDGLSRSDHAAVVTTLAGERYALNVTNEAGAIRVRSRWASARVVGSVHPAAPMAVYQLDRVLLPGALFRARPPVAAAPPGLAPTPIVAYGASAPDAGEAASAGGATTGLDRKAGEAADADSGAGAPRWSYAASFGAAALVAL